MAFGVVVAVFGCWDLGVGSLWWWGLLDVVITTLVPIVFILSLAFLCICTDDVKYDHAHNSHSRGGGRKHVK